MFNILKFINKGLLLISMVTFLGISTVNGEVHTDIDDTESKKILGYDVYCYSRSDLLLEEDKKNHTAYNFCTKEAVNLVLNKAKEIKTPNFGGDLKLITINPYVKNKLQKYYSLVVVIDEKAKKIYPDNNIFASEKYLDRHSDKKITPVGQVYTDKNSFMYCFKNKNKDIGYITDDSYYVGDEIEGDYICGVNVGADTFNERPYFRILPNEGYNLFGGKRPEKTHIYEINHRTAKELMK